MRRAQELTIRSLTLGLPWDRLGPENWPAVKAFLDEAERLCAKKGISIRTRRLVLPPVQPDQGMVGTQMRSLVRNVVKKGEDCSLRWICLPISGLGGWSGEDIRLLAPALVSDAPRLFINFLFREYDALSPAVLSTVGEQILAISRISNNGFDNFRVGAGFNTVPGTPFFPFSWHAGPPSFSFAVESLVPLLRALGAGSADFAETLATICAVIEEVGQELERLAEGQFSYVGQDISLAPYPNATDSIAILMEKLGLGAFGRAGTSTLTSRLTRLLKTAIRQTGVRSTGFNGVMFSPLEDRGISRSMAERPLDMASFMLWSTLCGCGVDMIPVPGNVDARSIGALYADVATLSNRHAKPLGVRILPIPNRRVNQLTQFNHDFLVNTPIVDMGGALEQRFME